jgi:hypothetical protein
MKPQQIVFGGRTGRLYRPAGSGRKRGNGAGTEEDKCWPGSYMTQTPPRYRRSLAATHRWLARYNATLDMAASDRHALLLERLAAVGDGAVIRPPFHCDYGFNIRLGAGALLNFNCVILEVVEVTIGDRTQIGPGCRSSRPTIRATRPYEPPVSNSDVRSV